jgi:ribosome maturation factor RimP
VKTDLEALVESELDALSYDLVLLRRGGTRTRPVLEIRIDRRDGAPVSVNDCVRASRAIEARLDAGDGPFGGGRYELQVSSPGEARRRPAHDQLNVQGSTVDERADRGTNTGAKQGSEHTDAGSRDGRIG